MEFTIPRIPRSRVELKLRVRELERIRALMAQRDLLEGRARKAPAPPSDYDPQGSHEDSGFAPALAVDGAAPDEAAYRNAATAASEAYLSALSAGHSPAEALAIRREVKAAQGDTPAYAPRRQARRDAASLMVQSYLAGVGKTPTR